MRRSISRVHRTVTRSSAARCSVPATTIITTASSVAPAQQRNISHARARTTAATAAACQWHHQRSSSSQSSNNRQQRRSGHVGSHVAMAAAIAMALTGATLVGAEAESVDEPNVPATAEARMYSSRQLALFRPDVHIGDERKSGLAISDIMSLHIPHLSEQFPDMKKYPNKIARPKLSQEDQPTVTAGYNQMITEDEVVLMDIVRKSGLSQEAKGFVRAGPRSQIVWAPGEVKAAIATCGGLCPGLNDVVEELVEVLYYNYGVDDIFGVKMGYRGFWQPAHQPMMKLTPESVEGIHNLGGTVLGSSRGGFDHVKILDQCQQHGINQLYLIGGDGTHRAADIIYKHARDRGLKMTVVGIPKTIDNDIGTIDNSFGFDTAVEEARKAIHSAVVEASCTPRGIGIVKLMGRHAGYIAAHATLASRQVDLCLIPEVPFPLHGDTGILKHMDRILDLQGHGVVVVAEGAGVNLLKDTGARDESGNLVLPDIATYLQGSFTEYFKTNGKGASMKFHDPSYMIRSVPANASDSIYCDVLAQNAVHGAMAGFSGFTSAKVNNRTVFLPFSIITATSPSYLNPRGRTWERVVLSTHQPNWSGSSDASARAQRETIEKDTKEKAREIRKETQRLERAGDVAATTATTAVAAQAPTPAVAPVVPPAPTTATTKDAKNK